MFGHWGGNLHPVFLATAWCLVPGVPLCRDNAGLTSSAGAGYQLPATACHENSCMHALAGLGWAGLGGEERPFKSYLYPATCTMPAPRHQHWQHEADMSEYHSRKYQHRFSTSICWSKCRYFIIEDNEYKTFLLYLYRHKTK